MPDEEPRGLDRAVIRPTKKLAEEFKEFAVRGNAVDLAVGVVIGAAFGKIITSLVSDIVTPPLSLLLGRVNFSNLYINLTRTRYATLEEAKAAGAATINYGAFLMTILDFVLISAVIFMMVRYINRSRKQAPPPGSDKKQCPKCMSTIPLPATRCAFCTSDL